MSYQSLNPASGKLLQSFAEITDAEFEKKIAAATACYDVWRHKALKNARLLLPRLPRS